MSQTIYLGCLEVVLLYSNVFSSPFFQAFGFSVPGLSVHAGPGKERVVTKEKQFGKTLHAENISSLLQLYLDPTDNKRSAVLIAKIFKEKLNEILKLFETQTTFHFFASSLLFVYDGEAALQFEQAGDEAELRKSVQLKMIDFAHVWPAEGELDQNYIRGVHSLIKLFCQIEN